MAETLDGSDAKIWYIEHNGGIARDFCDDLGKEMKDVFEEENARGVLREFTDAKKVPTLVSYLIYERGERQGCGEHLDVDGVFAHCVLFIKDSSKGRLNIRDCDLPEELNPSDALFMETRTHHWVTFCERDDRHKVVIIRF